MKVRVGRLVALAAAVGMLLCVGAPAQAAKHPPAAVQSAFIRVNQVGYPDSAPKRAYLMASDVETGASFAVRTPAARPCSRRRSGAT